ncbi:hypothetical protein GCM10027598_63370 [Amycolatopsis oliviviridis]|uniref:Uncharacterized protein n=1 Tax=Amycolatopsis oliviviridis TaxID=1471590 RepID=A0ABQ3M474_9PSEU|nr:hypothetical protein GCM10017790_71670 [Amycolatopsis oliviviridis]
MAATEIAFASDVFGSGLDWSITTGFRTSRRSKSCGGCNEPSAVRYIVNVAMVEPPSGQQSCPSEALSHSHTANEGSGHANYLA